MTTDQALAADVTPASPDRPPELDSYRPIGQTILFGVQHVLVMAATPISSVFLISGALKLGPELTAQLLAATLVFSGIGSILQSQGVGPFGPKLPFVMLPGGAPVILFISIAQAKGVQVAVGAVMLTAVFYFVVLPIFQRLLRFFPTLVIGTMITVVGINLVKIGAQLIFGKPGTPTFGNGPGIILGLSTIGFTVLAVLFGRGFIARVAPIIGLLAGTVLAFLMGVAHVGDPMKNGLIAVPQPMPFGMPEFDLLAALPLLIFSIASMAEATGQTSINAEAVGARIDLAKTAPKTIRADALVSFAGSFFGMPLMVTSCENVGIVRMTGVKSRYVTVAAGIILIAAGLFAPLVQLITIIPDAVVGGTAVVVFGVIVVLGIQMLGRIDLHDHATMVIVAVSIGLGLMPVLLANPYVAAPAPLRMILENAVAMSAFTAVILNALFNHGPLGAWRRRTREAASGATNDGASS